MVSVSTGNCKGLDSTRRATSRSVQPRACTITRTRTAGEGRAQPIHSQSSVPRTEALRGRTGRNGDHEKPHHASPLPRSARLTTGPTLLSAEEGSALAGLVLGSDNGGENDDADANAEANSNPDAHANTKTDADTNVNARVRGWSTMVWTLDDAQKTLLIGPNDFCGTDGAGAPNPQSKDRAILSAPPEQILGISCPAKSPNFLTWTSLNRWGFLILRGPGERQFGETF